MKHTKHSEQGETSQDRRAAEAAGVRRDNAVERRAEYASHPHPIEIHISQDKPIEAIR